MLTHTLKTPVTHGDKTYTTLTFREAETGDLIIADSIQGSTAKAAAMLALMSDVPLPAFKKIKAREFMRIMDMAKDLLGNDEDETIGEDTTGD